MRAAPPLPPGWAVLPPKRCLLPGALATPAFAASRSRTPQVIDPRSRTQTPLTENMAWVPLSKGGGRGDGPYTRPAGLAKYANDQGNLHNGDFRPKPFPGSIIILGAANLRPLIRTGKGHHVVTTTPHRPLCYLLRLLPLRCCRHPLLVNPFHSDSPGNIGATAKRVAPSCPRASGAPANLKGRGLPRVEPRVVSPRAAPLTCPSRAGAARPALPRPPAPQPAFGPSET